MRHFLTNRANVVNRSNILYTIEKSPLRLPGLKNKLTTLSLRNQK